MDASQLIMLLLKDVPKLIMVGPPVIICAFKLLNVSYWDSTLKRIPVKTVFSNLTCSIAFK